MSRRNGNGNVDVDDAARGSRARALSDDVAAELGAALADAAGELAHASRSAPSRRRRIARSALWKNAAGEWCLRYDGGANATGGRHRPTVVLGQLRDRRSAEAMARAFLQARTRVKRGAASLEVGVFARTYVEEALPRLKPGSAATSRSVIEAHVVRRFGALLLHVVRDHVQPWIDEQARADPPVAVSTVKTRVAVLRALLREAVRRRLIGAEHLPARPVWPRAQRLEREGELLTFTAAEQALVLEAARWPLKAVLAFGFYVGLRPGESLALEWPNVNFKRGELRVAQQLQRGEASTLKTATSAATVAMPPELVHIVTSYDKHVRREALSTGRRSDWLFANEDGLPLSLSTVRMHQLYPLLERLELPRRGLHACRHAFADRLLEAGTPIRTIQAAMRHASLEATERYLSRAAAPHVAAAIARAAREAAKVSEIGRATYKSRMDADKVFAGDDA